MIVVLIVLASIIVALLALLWSKRNYIKLDENEQIVSTQPGQQVKRISYNKAGVIYEFLDPNGTPCYVGQTVNLDQRINSHYREATQKGRFHTWLALEVNAGHKLHVREVYHGMNGSELDRLEKRRIADLQAQGVMLLNETYNKKSKLSFVVVKDEQIQDVRQMQEVISHE